MSGYAFDLKGLEQTIANLDTTVRKVGDGANHVLREGAEIYKSALVNNTPLGPGIRYGHARDHVKVGYVRTDKTMHKSVKAGYDSNVAWRMYFVNDGTYSKGNPTGIRPRRIVERTISATGPSIERTLADGIRSLIGGGV